MRLLFLLLASVSLTWAADEAGSIQSLLAAVRSAIRSGQPDRDVARIIDQLKMNQRLEDAVVEELQSEGAGPEAMEMLERQRELSRELPRAAQPPRLFDAPRTPSAEEQLWIIEKARQMALEYTSKLPDFLCTETVHRSVTGANSQDWRTHDTLSIDVGYSKKGEQYKLLAINDKPTNKKLASVGGFKSSGEFGTLLKRIFVPEADAYFQWERWTNLRGRPTYVFSYRIDQSRSTYTLNFVIRLKRYHKTTGMRGLVYIDRETNQVMRFSDEADGLPANWPILRTPSVLDYDYSDVGGQRYLLPRHVDSRVILKDGQSRNVMDFGSYRKFSSEVTLTFEK